MLVIFYDDVILLVHYYEYPKSGLLILLTENSKQYLRNCNYYCYNSLRKDLHAL